MDSPCIKQSVCKVLNIFQHGEYLVAYVLNQLEQYSMYEPWYEISNNLVCATSKGSDQPALTGSLIRASTSRLNIL